MNKLVLGMLVLFSGASSFAEAPQCKDLLKKSMELHRLSLRNLNTLEEGLMEESKTILGWANLTDQAFRRKMVLSTEPMRINAGYLRKSAGKLSNFNNEISQELMNIHQMMNDCK